MLYGIIKYNNINTHTSTTHSSFYKNIVHIKVTRSFFVFYIKKVNKKNLFV